VYLSGGFLFGAVAGYALKKVMKIAAIVIGLFVIGLSYLPYRGWIDVRWIEIENATRSTLTKWQDRPFMHQITPHHNLQHILLQ